MVVGVAYLLNPVSYAEFTIYPKLVIMGNISQTVANISSHHGLFLTALFCYLINFIEDIIIAWGLYILLAPVNRALSCIPKPISDSSSSRSSGRSSSCSGC